MTKGRPINITWNESKDELYKKYQDETGHVPRQRTQFLWLVRSGKSITESSQLAGFSKRSGERYINWYREGGIESVLGRTHGGQVKTSTGYLTHDQEEQIKTRANQGFFKSVWDGIAWVKQEFDVDYTYSGMRSVFKRLNLKKKVPRKQHIKSDPEAQALWKKGAYWQF